MTLPKTPRYEVVVIGGGIVGLATAYAAARSGRSVAVVEREPRLATHQTGRNSNVIHSGLYYAPGGRRRGWPSRGARRPSRSAARTTCRTGCAASSWSPPSPTSCRG